MGENQREVTSDVNFKRIWAMPSKWTFQIKYIYEYLLSIIKNKVVLNPFAGLTRLPGNVLNIDKASNLPGGYIIGDCIPIMEQMIREGMKFDVILSDPPFTFYQSVHIYNQAKMTDIGYCKNLYDMLISPEGEIISFGYNSTGMGAKRNYRKVDITLVNFGGNHNDMIILREKKTTFNDNL